MDPKTRAIEIEIPIGLMSAFERISKEGGRCRIVGGSVRDALLGLSPKDFDIEVFGMDLDRIAQLLGEIGKTDLVGKSFCVVKFWKDGKEYDFSIPRKERKEGTGHRGFAIEADSELSEKEALSRRDFTINALMYDPGEGVIIDYFGGLDDLENKVLRHVGPAFVEDPLRVLRGAQFAGRFGFSLALETAAICREMKREYATLAKERIWGEWKKWAAQSKSHSKGLAALKESSWLVFYSELNALLRVPQDPEWHPEGDVWIHTNCCLDALVKKTEWRNQDEDTRVALAFGVLCHDLGKARQTRFAEKRGKLRWISPGHDQDSKWLSQQLLHRIGAPLAIQNKVANLVANHHYLNSFIDHEPSATSLRKLSRRLHPATTAELSFVMKADHLGRPPLISEGQSERIATFDRKIKEAQVESSTPQSILLGRHLIDRGMKPGPEFKGILTQAYEAQIEGEFGELDDGLAWLDKWLEDR